MDWSDYSDEIPEEGEKYVDNRVKLIKTLEGHSMDVVCVLYFEKQNCLATCSNDDQIRIWNIKNGKCVVIKEHSNYIYQLIKWSETQFLSCSYDGKILCCDISNFDNIKYRVIFQHNGFVFRILKLTENRILLISEETLVIRFSDGKVDKILTEKKTDYNTRMIISKNFDKCLYFNYNDNNYSVYFNELEQSNSSSEDSAIYLLNFEEDKVVKKFSDHGHEIFMALCMYHNSRDEEIIIGGGYGKEIYFYNSGNCETPSSTKYFKKLTSEKSVVSLLYFRNYLFIGNYSGELNIFDLKEKKKEDQQHLQQPILKHTIHGDTLNDIVVTKIYGERGVLEMATCSSCSNTSDKLKIVRISGLNIRSENEILEMKDLKDRIEYLFDDAVKESLDNRVHFIKFNIFGIEFKMYTTFLLL